MTAEREGWGEEGPRGDDERFVRPEGAGCVFSHSLLIDLHFPLIAPFPSPLPVISPSALTPPHSSPASHSQTCSSRSADPGANSAHRRGEPTPAIHAL
jgi:hypothetical protein